MELKQELRDFFASSLMAGKVDDFTRTAHRENLAGEKETEIWVQVSSEEATKRNIKRLAKKAYEVADALIEAREL